MGGFVFCFEQFSGHAQVTHLQPRMNPHRENAIPKVQSKTAPPTSQTAPIAYMIVHSTTSATSRMNMIHHFVVWRSIFFTSPSQ